jgi:hypothetical protein
MTALLLVSSDDKALCCVPRKLRWEGASVADLHTAIARKVEASEWEFLVMIYDNSFREYVELDDDNIGDIRAKATLKLLRRPAASTPRPAPPAPKEQATKKPMASRGFVPTPPQAVTDLTIWGESVKTFCDVILQCLGLFELFRRHGNTCWKFVCRCWKFVCRDAGRPPQQPPAQPQQQLYVGCWG